MIEVRSFSGLAFRSAALTVVLLVIGAPPMIPGSTTAAATSDLKLIVGFGAGKGVDSIARVVA
jgi:tripartite-type tricarboxylate transporter receptor subunit TctC